VAEQDNRQPVEQRHIDFGQEVVALARKHGFHHLGVDFYGGERWTRVTMTWHEGRHGSESRITFKAEATHHCYEKPVEETPHD
jgi:hypothetical protein